MSSPVLHRVLGSWWVGNYPLRLTQEGRLWAILAHPGEIAAQSWLRDSRLSANRFSSRRDALSALMLALEMPGAVEPMPDPYCRHLGDGLYALAGELRASRIPSGDGWIILTSDSRQVGHAGSLWRAAWIAQVRFDDAKPRFAAPRGH